MFLQWGILFKWDYISSARWEITLAVHHSRRDIPVLIFVMGKVILVINHLLEIGSCHLSVSSLDIF